MKKLAISVALCLLIARNAHADSLCVDADHSSFRIRVETAGMLGALGHDHEIEAHGIKGCVEIDWTQLAESSVSLIFSTADIQVLDPDHPKDRPKVQEAMALEVLGIRDFPEIRFKSERVRPVVGRHALDTFPVTIDGVLTIRGHSQKVSILLVLKQTSSNSAKVSGTYVLKQSDFGITPIRVMGGVVKVKDEIKLEFDLQLWQSK